MRRQRNRVEHFIRDQGLRERHQPAVRRRLVVWARAAGGARIGPIAAERGVADIAAQQADGIGEVGIKLGVMLDQGRNGRLVGHRRAERAKSEPAERTPLDKIERSRGGEQPFGRIDREPEIGRQVVWRRRSRPQQIEELQAHAGIQHLGVDEAGAQIEEGASSPSRHWPCQRESRGPPLKARTCEDTVTPREPAVQYRYRRRSDSRPGPHDVLTRRAGRTSWASAAALRA